VIGSREIYCRAAGRNQANVSGRDATSWRPGIFRATSQDIEADTYGVAGSVIQSEREKIIIYFLARD
jgi:hypothetical protein